MKNLKLRKGYELYILLGVVLFSSCQEKVVIIEQQSIEITIDTTYTYKIKREDNFFDIHKTTEKYEIGDTIRNIY